MSEQCKLVVAIDRIVRTSEGDCVEVSPYVEGEDGRTLERLDPVLLYEQDSVEIGCVWLGEGNIHTT